MTLPRPILRAVCSAYREINRDRLIAKRREIRLARIARLEATLDQALANQRLAIIRAQTATFAMAITAAAMARATAEAA